jgi:hypothetical protein
VRARTAVDWLWFGGWIVVGVGAAFGVVSFPLALFPAGLVAWLLSRDQRRMRAAWGSVSGVGLLLLYVAYLQRHGPGEYCHPVGTPKFPGRECGDYLDPRPWLVAGILLAVIGIVGFIVQRCGRVNGRRHRRDPGTLPERRA